MGECTTEEAFLFHLTEAIIYIIRSRRAQCDLIYFETKNGREKNHIQMKRERKKRQLGHRSWFHPIIIIIIDQLIVAFLRLNENNFTRTRRRVAVT